MPMPDYSGEWPPKPWDTAQDAYNTFDAWWSGDTAELQAIYRYERNRIPMPRPGQLAGGLWGALNRMWWGRPVMPDTTRLHIPAPADIATMSADLLFGQPPSWTLNDGDATDVEAAQDRLDQLLGGPDTKAIFLEAGEIQAALGGVFVRLYWDQSVMDKVKLGAVAPDCAIPEWRYGALAAVTFWTVVSEDKAATWRHLERHEAGRIYHALYCGDSTDIGRIADLADQDATAWAAELVGADGSIETGVNGLTACYVPNVRPARRWRNVPQLSPLGRSDFESVEPLFDQLDEAWSSWMRDLDLAKARLFVSRDALEDFGPGKGAAFDPEQQIFTGVPNEIGQLPENAPSQLVQPQQFEIRVQEHSETCDRLVKEILRATGYSSADYGDEGAGAMTATEVSARKDSSSRTRSRKILYWQSEMQPLARTMLELDQKVYGGSYGIKADPTMDFPPRADMSPLQMSQTILNLSQAEAASTETKVRMANPAWSNPKVMEEVERIQSEKQLSVPDQLPGEFGPEDPNMQPDAHSGFQGDAGTEPVDGQDDMQQAA